MTGKMLRGGHLAETSWESAEGWYVGSYVQRFAVLDDPRIEDSEARFPTWENTVLIRAGSIAEAFAKVERIGREADTPYLAGDPPGVMARWVFEGVTEVLPVYEPLEDGAEIMWADLGRKKLKNIRLRAAAREEPADD
ncbi:MAG: DUF4288 domain-containing protein [Rhodocyclaceae bacterium]|nr:DUF4288 domain-containing protein [Rhodocyclaceae bacterium]